jgi:hypothetical protein
MKDLPHVFAGKVEHTTNKEMDRTSYEEKQPKSESYFEKTVEQKIKEILNDSTYIYKKRVIIKTKDEQIEKQLIGRNKDYIITLDNEKIPISDIEDIYPK